MFDADAVTVIEWAERLQTPPQGAVEVNIEYLTDTERRVTIGSRLSVVSGQSSVVDSY